MPLVTETDCAGSLRLKKAQNFSLHCTVLVNKIHMQCFQLKIFQYCSQLNMIFKMNLLFLTNNIFIQDQISKKWVTYNVPLFLEQMIIKSWGQKFIIFLFLLHIPINLKYSKNIIVTSILKGITESIMTQLYNCQLSEKTDQWPLIFLRHCRPYWMSYASRKNFDFLQSVD